MPRKLISRQLWLQKIDWVGADKSRNLAAFSAEVTSRLEPLYRNLYDYAESISSEIELVVSILVETADKLLPSFEPKKKKEWRDDIISCLCEKVDTLEQFERLLAVRERNLCLMRSVDYEMQ